MELGELMSRAPSLHVPWLKAAFLCFLVGYGTKMGLAPLHTWLPDAHSESPSVVSALLSGALLNCAFLGILRAMQVCAAAGLASFAQELLVIFGLISIGTAAVFILGQADFKRMLAYSSVEHMGILALGVGLGGAATFGAMMHAVNHSLVKAALFMTAGNLLAAYGTKTSSDVRGAARVVPVTAALWIAGVLAITGFPPFGTFLSEFTILRAALDQGRPWVATAYVGLLALVFVGMTASALPMLHGATDRTRRGESRLSLVSPIVMIAAVLVLGVFVPPAVSEALRQAAAAFP
jgi:hydrogenase-4 component F